MEVSDQFVSLRLLEQPPRGQIHIEITSEPIPADKIVENLRAVQGPIDVYCWYEGTQGLPTAGALFMKESIFEPLFGIKSDAELCLYSLRGWDFKKTNGPSTALGEAINRINGVAIKCFYSSSFFQYCKEVSAHSEIYRYINEELPKKDWLFALSRGHKEVGKKAAFLFDDQPSLFDCIRDLDCSLVYSAMQYVEGYYLIQESVKKGLLRGQRKIEIAFILPNDESKYYLDFPQDIERMLEMDFRSALSGVEINITIQCFQYGDSIACRPYIDKRRKAPKVRPEEIESYFKNILDNLSRKV